MNNANRVIFNTLILYIKIVISSLFSLISVPLIMHSLGTSDYGLYSLIGGVVGLLAFFKAAISVSTQRFISVAMGENDSKRINCIYNTSLDIHLFLGFAIVIVLELLSLFLFDIGLNIESGRISSAKIVYQFLIFTTFFEISSVPYIGLINAKEDMIVFSLLGILESMFKLILAYFLACFSIDRLIVYAAGMFAISFIIMTLNVSFVRYRYKEFDRKILKYFNKSVFKDMSGFIGWNTIGALAVVGRNQGIAIVMNLFLGTMVNAAYGIANQINGVLGYFSNTFQKSINPQLMKSQGMNNVERLVRLSFVSSKFSVIVMSLISIPLIIEMEYVLNIWLDNPPYYTVNFARLILIASVLSQYSVGLISAISAVGNIRNYQIVISVILLINIPLSYFCLKNGMPPYFCILSFIVTEAISLVVRVLFAYKIVGIQPLKFLRDVICPLSLCILVSFFLSIMPRMLIDNSLLRFVSVCCISVVTFLFSAWFIALNKEERLVFVGLYHKIL